MKRPSKTPPERIPFQRGRKSVQVSTPVSAPLAWIAPAVWALLKDEGTEAHRVGSAPGMWLERFGADLLLSYQHERSRDGVLAELEERCAVYGFRPGRVFAKYLPQQAAERDVPALVRGPEGLALGTEATEAGVRYGLDFAGGYSAGLFIDQRANRAQARAYRPARLLNTFAYTCSFSVAAALAGAETVSVDLSRRSLTRGKENFQRNGIEVNERHRFLADDVLAVLPRLARRGEKFDGIILDPPTFSRNQAGAAFQVQRDFEKLAELALEVAAPGARILLSVNHSEMRVADLERAARYAMRLRNRAGRFFATPALIDFPAGHGAKTLWLELDG